MNIFYSFLAKKTFLVARDLELKIDGNAKMMIQGVQYKFSILQNHTFNEFKD